MYRIITGRIELRETGLNGSTAPYLEVSCITLIILRINQQTELCLFMWSKQHCYILKERGSVWAQTHPVLLLFKTPPHK